MNETIRLLIFTGSFVLFAILESLKPKRVRIYRRIKRWPSNILLVGFNTLLIRLIPWLLPFQIAAYAKKNGWGLLNILSWNYWIEFIIAIILLDLIIYWQHRFFHRIVFLRKIHRLHHLEQDLDVTSALKFHPFEIIISLFIKSIAVLILGLSIDEILVFESILNTMAMFNHMNVRMPEKLDSLLRKVIVTPDMHRVHHSINPVESDMNFGFNLSLWDYIFKSYLKDSRKGQIDMKLGHAAFLDDKYTSFHSS